MSIQRKTNYRVQVTRTTDDGTDTYLVDATDVTHANWSSTGSTKWNWKQGTLLSYDGVPSISTLTFKIPLLVPDGTPNLSANFINWVESVSEDDIDRFTIEVTSIEEINGDIVDNYIVIYGGCKLNDIKIDDLGTNVNEVASATLIFQPQTRKIGGDQIR